MKNIKAKDLRVIEKNKVEEWQPKFLGMKKEDIFSVQEGWEHIKGYDKGDNEIYYENSEGHWRKSEYKKGREVYFEDSEGYWRKNKYKDGNHVYFEDSNGCWRKSEYKDGNEVYFENSKGEWWKQDGENEIEYKDGEYYLNGKEAELIK